MKFSIKRAVSVAAIAAVAGVGTFATANATTVVVKDSATTSVAGARATPALKPGQLKFALKNWSSGDEGGAGALVPSGWKKAQLSTNEAQFSSSNGLWKVRIDGYRGERYEKQSQAAAINAKVKALKSQKNFRVLSIVDGTTKSIRLGQKPLFTTKTMTYTYTAGNRGTRLVIHRFFDGSGYDKCAMVEVAAAGRVQDRVGLHKVIDRATAGYYLAG